MKLEPIICILLLLFFADFFLWWSGWRVLRKSAPWRGKTLCTWLFHAFFVFQLAGMVALLYIRSAHLAGNMRMLPLSIGTLVFLWHLMVLPLVFLGNLIARVGNGLRALFRRSPEKTDTLPGAGAPLSRREFLATVATLAPPVLTFALSGAAAKQMGEFRIRRLTISLPGLPAKLDGLTIAHLSDIHIGQFSTRAQLHNLAIATNALKPDLAVCTGDLVNDRNSSLTQGIHFLKSIHAPTFLCEGNHDIMFGYRFEQKIRDAKLHLLINQSHTLSLRGVPVQLLGLRWDGPHNLGSKDESDLRQDVAELLETRNPAAFPILLAHHPHAWDYCGDLPLTLAGHTHGGQFMLNKNLGFGPLMFRYWSGLYTRATGQALVVSNGAGNWLPLRTAAPAEIVHIMLRKG